ncbi:MAG: class I SAM-dependent methyltransferase, partial [Chloroflexi bacterium]|nr:class I SAM-dependent methyltransferase [Chloroflexota bacterium]
VEVVVGRAEELGRSPDHREKSDLVLCRAVAGLAALAELCLPLCRVGGRFIAHKKGDIALELKEAEAAIRVMGGAPARVVPVRLEGLGDDRVLVVIDKARPTPPGYPRRPGMPEKRPVRSLEGS